MGGTITVHSESGVGTEFLISLRFPIGHDTPTQTPIPSPSCPVFSGKHLLLAEDNALNAEIATAILEDAGFTVDTVSDGAEAVTRIETTPAGTYDLILMDIQMPNMNGYEAAQRIRAIKDAERSTIPIIAMTANAFEENRQAALSAGMNGHLAKPIEIPKLMELLSKALQ